MENKQSLRATRKRVLLSAGFATVTLVLIQLMILTTSFRADLPLAIWAATSIVLAVTVFVHVFTASRFMVHLQDSIEITRRTAKADDDLGSRHILGELE